MQARFKATGAAIARIGAGIAAAGVAGVTAGLGAAVKFAAAGDQLDKMSGRTGVAASQLSTLGFAAERSGASLADVENGIRGMQRQLINFKRGSAEAVDAFADLGLTISDLEGLNPEQQFKLIADRLSQVDDQSTRAGLAMKVFGRSGTALLPMLANGAKGIEELQQKARDLGLEISDEQAKAAAEFTDAWGDLKSQFSAIATQVGAALAPALTKLARFLAPILVQVIDWIKANPRLIQGMMLLFTAAAGIGSALFGIGTAITFIIPAISAIGSAISAVVGFVFTPWGLAIIGIVAAVGALVYGLYRLVDWFLTSTQAGRWLVQMFTDLYKVATATMTGIFNAISGGDLGLAGDIAMGGLMVAFQYGINQLRPMWHGFLDYLFDNFGTTIEAIVDVFKGAVQIMLKGMSELYELTGETEIATTARNLSTGIGIRIDNALKNLTDPEKRAAMFADATREGDEALAELVSELGGKLREASALAASSDSIVDEGGVGMPDMAEVARSTFGTFSAAQALALGGNGGQGFERQMLNQGKEQVNVLKQIKRNTDLPPGWAIQ